MNNRQLTIFRTVCEEGSMTKAAEKLYMTQPAVSQTIKELEQESGVCFLERYNRKVVPTERQASLSVCMPYPWIVSGFGTAFKRNGRGADNPYRCKPFCRRENAAWIYPCI